MTEVKIGLETHVQLDTETKLFCGCPNKKTDEPNTNVCETCLGHPGSKPRLNEAVLDQAVKTAQALQCSINEDIFFSRKTYFYPDMSKNYQITQYEIPVGEDGIFEVKIGDEKKQVGITRLHIEEDPAKLLHEGGNIGSSNYTKVDYNRAGTPLLEIVTEPDFKSPEEARKYLQQLAQMLEYLEAYHPESDFSIKSDANISIDGGQRVEVKNITGTKGIEKALSYEISRQKQLKKRGREVKQVTRNYDANQEITEKLREKETEEDYGYIFDPDLTRQALSEDYRRALQDEIPELPHEKFERFKEEYGLPEKMVESLVAEQRIAGDFEKLAEKHDSQLVASWLTGEVRKTLNYNDISYSESKLSLEFLEDLIGLIEGDGIVDRNAEKMIREKIDGKYNEDLPVEKIAEEEDLLKAEASEIDSWVEESIDENPEAVEDFHEGKDEAINFLVGQVMQKSQGKADPKTAREKVRDELE